MAVYPYFVFGPNTLASIWGFIKGPDKTIPTPAENWEEAIVDVVIPALNEEKNIALCLASIQNQTLKPRNIYLIDDGSNDKTLEYAKKYSEQNSLNINLIKRAKPIGKTPTLKRQARELDSDVEFILDGDTILLSDDYIERTVQELYQGVGIASACGTILPLYDNHRKSFLKLPSLKKFVESTPDYDFNPNSVLFNRINQYITNLYRNVLYIYLQRFIYLGQMVFTGSITNPVGCAVAYRRKYIKDLFDKYEPVLGDDLTTSEDIFIGFALANNGYRNIQLTDVYARSQEPKLTRLPRQIFLWSSSFYQSCYYFNNLLNTPFKSIKNILTLRHFKKEREEKEFKDKRKIKEAYRQPFGEEFTKKYGRPIGWIMFTSLIEKICYPIFLILMISFRWWEALIVTLIAENFIYLVTLMAAGKKHSVILKEQKNGNNNSVQVSFGGRFKFFMQGLVTIPVRYMSVFVDFISLLRFCFDVWILRNRNWRK